MAEKAKKIAAALVQRWKALGKKVKIILGAGVVAVLVGLAILFMVVSNQPYATLFADLNQTDMSAILTYLSDNGITQYKVEDDTILVPEKPGSHAEGTGAAGGVPLLGIWI